MFDNSLNTSEIFFANDLQNLEHDKMASSATLIRRPLGREAADNGGST